MCRLHLVQGQAVRFVMHNGVRTVATTTQTTQATQTRKWDNNQGADYHIHAPGVYLLDCGVITRLDVVSEHRI